MKSILVIALISVITACSTTKHVVVSPELIGYKKGVYFNNKIKLKTLDQRTNTYIVQIIKEGQPAKLLSSQVELPHIVSQKITPILRKQGLTINNSSPIIVNIIIDKALIEVNQNILKYTAKNSIDLKATVKNGDTLLTKRFSVNGTSKGPLTADIAVLERDFNHQLASTLVNIVNNKEIQDAIKANVNSF